MFNKKLDKLEAKAFKRWKNKRTRVDITEKLLEKASDKLLGRWEKKWVQYFKKSETYQDADLLEGVDIKNLKIRTPESHELYPPIIKYCVLYGLFALSMVIAEVFLSVFLYGIGGIGIFLICSIFYAIIFIALWQNLWWYYVFKLGVAQDLKKGDKICLLLKKFILRTFKGCLAIHIIPTFFIGPFFNESAFFGAITIGSGIAALVIGGAIYSALYEMEMSRLGLKVFMQAVGDLLGKKEEGEK